MDSRLGIPRRPSHLGRSHLGRFHLGRWAVCGLIALGGPLAGSGTRVGAEDGAVPTETGAAASEVTVSKLPGEAKDRKCLKPLVDAARTYFDPSEDPWTARKTFLQALVAIANERGHQPLMDMHYLRWLIAQGRSFRPQMDDNSWRKSEGLKGAAQALTGFELKGPGLWMHMREPAGYPEKNLHLERNYERDGPWPALYVMHNKSQQREDGTGRVVIDEFWSKEAFPAVAQSWFTVVPIVAAGAYSEGGRLRVDRARQPLMKVCQHYHVDYERIVLDGGQDALLMLSSYPLFFAGCILREGALDTEKLQKSVGNYHAVPLYVVKKPELAAALRAAGHPSVAEGDGKDLQAWLDARRRAEPKSFTWSMRESDQQMAWWINIDQPAWDQPVREIVASIVNTPESPNTVRLTTKGIHEISVFLNDELVDLDEPVRIEINGVVVRDEKVPVPEGMEPLGRDLNTLFQYRSLALRTTPFFWWLRSATFERLVVPEPKVEPAGDNAGAGDAVPDKDVEDKATRLLARAEELIAADDLGRARRILESLLELPANSHSARAKELLVGLPE